MAAASETGIPKLRIAASAAKRQAQIDSGTQVIVGVNNYHTETPDSSDVLEIDNAEVLTRQLARLAAVRAERSEQRVQERLAALREAAATNTGNLLELAVAATRARATGGDITKAPESSFTRYQAATNTVPGA